MSPIRGCPRYKVLHPCSPSLRHRIALHVASSPALVLIQIASGVARPENLAPVIADGGILTHLRASVSMLWCVPGAPAKLHRRLPLQSIPVIGRVEVHRQPSG